MLFRSLIRYHKELIRIRKEHPVCRKGSGTLLLAERGILSFIRFDETDQLLIVINNLEEGKKLKLPVWLGEVRDGVLMDRLMLSVEDGFTTESACYLTLGGEIEIFMPPFSAAVLAPRQEEEQAVVKEKFICSFYRNLREKFWGRR